MRFDCKKWNRKKRRKDMWEQGLEAMQVTVAQLIKNDGRAREREREMGGQFRKLKKPGNRYQSHAQIMP